MADFSEKTIEQLKEIVATKNEELKGLEKKCIEERLSWEDACDKMRPLATEIFEINEEIRLKESPEMVFGKKWKGDLIPLKTFIEKAKDGSISDNTGYGYYATKTGKSNIKVYAVDVINNKLRKDFDYVIWF